MTTWEIDGELAPIQQCANVGNSRRYSNPRIASTMRSWEGMTSNSRRSL